MAELRTAELVVPTPIACTFTLWKRQQRSVLEMDFLLPVVCAYAFFDSPTHSAFWCPQCSVNHKMKTQGYVL